MKYEELNSYQSKDMANVKVFADKQTDGRSNREAKDYMPLMYRCSGIKTISTNAMVFQHRIHTAERCNKCIMLSDLFVLWIAPCQNNKLKFWIVW